jgi:hypothetical protein
MKKCSLDKEAKEVSLYVTALEEEWRGLFGAHYT